MNSPARIPLPDSFGLSGPDLVDQLLAEQQSLTAVERFSSRHDTGFPADTQSLYRDLVPLRAPAPGEQYAFEVDLDRCTGCKACVTACHSMNGLDEDEAWRSVGVLQQVAVRTLEPAQQHITTACHHCAEPGCAQGCPTLAYEKDPATGIVQHLDDQCFGCQYCILKCPYDVPQYNPKRGIVRKCDLCIGRLRAGEAPACAQACPTKAIRVTLVELAAVCHAPEAAFDRPDAPSPARVKPTTRYVSKRGLPQNLVAADASQVRPEHAHTPLVLMLVASQAAAGYWILQAMQVLIAMATAARTGSRNLGVTAGAPDLHTLPWIEVLGVVGVQLALALSLLHLGRPWLAWKAFLGWRRSWLSREVIAFSALAASTGAFALLAVVDWSGRVALPTALHSVIRAGLAGAVLLSALAALYASAMVYRDTPRLLWATRATLWRFSLTALICGIPAWLLIKNLSGDSAGSGLPTLLLLIPIATLFKLLLEAEVLRHRNDDEPNALWKAAQLLWGPYRTLRTMRGVLAFTGGMILPVALFVALRVDHIAPGGGTEASGLAAAFLFVLCGELIERFFFFTTGIAPRMPGGRK